MAGEQPLTPKYITVSMENHYDVNNSAIADAVNVPLDEIIIFDVL